MSAPLRPSPSSPGHNPLTAEGILLELRKRLSPDVYETWFRSFRLRYSDAEAVEFTVPSHFHRDWITRHYARDVEAALRGLGAADRRLSITVAAAEALGAEAARAAAEGPPAVSSPAPSADRDAEAIGPKVARLVDHVRQNYDARTGAPPSPAASAPAAANGRSKSVLNRRYTFEDFVVGECNQVAHDAAVAVGANPGHAYNPFFVHGNVGLGKTHLLQATCHAVLQLHPNARVIYVSCEEFTNNFIEASRSKTLEAFRAYYRSADVLVIDDVEFLANKSHTQSEFFHTFNALYNDEKQIVISSDRPAPEIPSLEERLVSRFKWGFETSIEPPSYETRVAIAGRKAFVRSIELPLEVAEFIAGKVTGNIRELEGAVVKVLGLATLTGKPLDRRLAADALQDGEFGRAVKVTLADILNLVSSEFSLTAKEIVGKRRTQAISGPRQIGMYLARSHTKHSLEEIGRFFGNRDHTTILYGVERVSEQAQTDHSFRGLLDRLSHSLTGGASAPAATRPLGVSTA